MTLGDAPDRARRLIYLVVGALLLVLAVVGVVLFDDHHDDEIATAKAERLHQLLIDAGLPAPAPGVIAAALGDDGGLVCADPDNPLVKARYQAAIVNGASGPASRPVIGDRDTVMAVELAIATYCPDRLGTYLDQVRTFELEHTTK
ncbi:hypothetical protein IU433_15970 [Nocardia puris]|uniref:DUF732 domain-containing protein n=1 Tax=Nocardia puris TaxID=208602 RepID=A0A366DAF4_9NOCA|nr:hypothetical protein [Nocardia puris]MBF6211817.1 hypothetical protein [Nocardia puris]MBF6365820.1 hypothetical protein [Nocardia puris]MBF6460537.1 hypothetical protein [Nocardia puris]RBO86996.1 hypothetical protein DFR74_112173 [Nocardia puris]